MIVSDNGTDPKATRSSQFTSTAILAWSQNHAIAWDCIAARKPTQNGFVESLQRPDARRTAEREPVPQPWPCPPELAAWTNDYLTAAAHAASLTATGRPPARLERCAARLVAHTTLRSVPNAATLVAAGRKLRGTSVHQRVTNGLIQTLKSGLCTREHRRIKYLTVGNRLVLRQG